MARKPTGRPNGRPRIEINSEQFKKLCELHCTKEEIAGFFSCTEETIDNYCKREHGESFLGVFKKLSAGGKMSLRRYQFELAKHNASMAIFLGKNLLGQTDNTEINQSEGLKIVVEKKVIDLTDGKNGSDTL
ncbi:MAG: hypothetical protein J6V66_00720 [Clostridia bacterium]|nr:hypothetical protein [Clostridia bacterium]